MTRTEFSLNLIHFVEYYESYYAYQVEMLIKLCFVNIFQSIEWL